MVDYEKSSNTYILDIKDVQESDGAIYQAKNHYFAAEIIVNSKTTFFVQVQSNLAFRKAREKEM